MKQCNICGVLLTGKPLMLIGKHKPIELCKECAVKFNKMLGNSLIGKNTDTENSK